MSNFPLLSKILVSCISLFGLFLAFLVYFSNKKSRINQLYFLMSFFVLFWISFYYLFDLTKQPYTALFWIRLASASVAGFLISFYFFFIYFLELEKKFKVLNKIILGIGVLLVVAFGFTNFFIPGVKIQPWGNDLILNNYVIIFYLFVAILSGFILFLLWKNYLNIPKGKRLKVQYFLLGSAIWVLFNLTFNVFLPLIKHSIRYHQFGDYSAFFLLGFTAYAIVKRNLFGIRVILTQILVGVIAILLFVQILDAKTTFDYIWKIALFLTFIIFGYLLIRSVLREIKLREELENAYVELQKLDKAKSEFISIASHQLRAPLAAMKGYISMIIEKNYGPISKQIETKLQNVFLSNERLIKMVNDLLNVSRIESGRIELNIQETPVEDVVKGVVDILKLQAKDKKLDLVWEKPAKSLPKALIDPDKTREIILNIIDNAIKYTQKGSIKVSAKAAPNSVLISIADTGAGMSEEEIAKMFKSFSRGAAGNQFFTEGMGLGLYIARQFTEMQKGKIWAESKGKGKGSTFFVELPIK